MHDALASIEIEDDPARRFCLLREHYPDLARVWDILETEYDEATEAATYGGNDDD